jgi:hypothetical protein
MKWRMRAITQCRYGLNLTAVRRCSGYEFGIHDSIVRRTVVIMCKDGGEKVDEGSRRIGYAQPG